MAQYDEGSHWEAPRDDFMERDFQKSFDDSMEQMEWTVYNKVFFKLIETNI